MINWENFPILPVVAPYEYDVAVSLSINRFWMSVHIEIQIPAYTGIEKKKKKWYMYKGVTLPAKVWYTIGTGSIGMRIEQPYAMLSN